MEGCIVSFPHPCGAEFERAVAAGADPLTAVPDGYFIVRGGTKPVPPIGQVFSCAAGPDLTAAACAVPYNQIRITTADAIRQSGGSVEWSADFSPHGTLNKQHVHVVEGGAESTFSEQGPNPVPKKDRIDG